MLTAVKNDEINIKLNSKPSLKPDSDPSNIKLMSKNEYRSVLKKYMSPEDFSPDTKELVRYFLFISLYLFGIYSLSNIQILPVKIVVSAIMGISLAALTFFMHDLMHGAIIKSRPLTYIIGLSIGIFNFFPPLFWQRVHNFHHARTGAFDDPDRIYILSEKPKTAIQRFIYNLRLSSDSYNTFFSILGMSFGFFWYFSTMFYAMLQRNTKFEKTNQYQGIHRLFKSKELFVVFGEVLLIISFQVFLFSVVARNSFLNYFLVSSLPVLIAHFTTMLYIHTNHFLSPLTEEVDDPLINSLSLKNSWIVDKVFSNFSHHVEHHLYPVMGSSHYPKVRKLLLKLYPNRLQLIPMIEAVKLLCITPRIYADNTHLVNCDNSKKSSCLLPKIEAIN